MKNTIFLRLTIVLIVLTFGALHAFSQTPDFTYQGRLLNSSLAANGNYDFQFSLCDAQANGNVLQVKTRLNVTVSSGIFTVRLDFPVGSFDGTDRFLEIAVKPAGDPNAFTTLSPRQPITSSPYSVRSLNAATADDSDKLGGITSDGFIHNGTTAQTGDFNISGGGTLGGGLSADNVNSATRYSINGNSVLSVPGQNTFVGLRAGATTTTGLQNTFIGHLTGEFNTAGAGNTFVGDLAGNQNSTVCCNSFFGTGAGQWTNGGGGNSFFGYGSGNSNTTGGGNSFFGDSSGQANTTGTFNSFFGRAAGLANTTGANNTFFGGQAGTSNTTASGNTFVGFSSGQSNTTGSKNAFIGQFSGGSNTTGHDNTFIGDHAGAANTGGTTQFPGNYNTFAGSSAGLANTTGYNNSFFGYQSGQSMTTGIDNSFFGSQAGLLNTGESNSFFGAGAGANSTTGGFNSFFGSSAGIANTIGLNNTFIGARAGYRTTTGSSNLFVGGGTANLNTTGSANTFVGFGAGGFNGAGSYITLLGFEAGVMTDNLTNANAIGSYAMVSQSNSLVLGSINGVNSATADTSVGIGTTAPKTPFHVATNGGNFMVGGAGCNAGYVALGFGPTLDCTNYSLLSNGSDTVINRTTGGSIYFMLNGVQQGGITPAGDLYSLNKIGLSSLGSAGSTALCRNASNQISTCSSSLRYKKDLHAFTPGLSLIQQLHPITFRWKADNMLDLGFGAEDIAKVEPLLVTHNDKGEVEGVKYDRISAVLVNAVKEQQAQIEAQQNQIQQQQSLIDGLKSLVCQSNRQAEVCK